MWLEVGVDLDRSLRLWRWLGRSASRAHAPQLHARECHPSSAFIGLAAESMPTESVLRHIRVLNISKGRGAGDAVMHYR
jgi:hypothetical protein